MPPKVDNPAPATPAETPVTTAATTAGSVSGNSVYATVTLDPMTGLVYILTALSLQIQFTGNSGNVQTSYSGTLTYNNIANLSGAQTASVSSNAGNIVITFVQVGTMMTAKFKAQGSTVPNETQGNWGPIGMSGLSIAADDGTTSAAFPVPPLEIWSKRTPATANLNLWTEKIYQVNIPALRSIFISSSGQGQSYAGIMYFNDPRHTHWNDPARFATVSIVAEHLTITFTTKNNTLVGIFKSSDYIYVPGYHDWDATGEWKNY
ncbi:hypothetical protein Clacol_004988 [Clathrus columnatus]|uniref:Uncharacterized protein n=1 Tax=Clathrus columnatus TaxID=1419009 RepID=A0AAV5ACX3_9AGAM|nr:hypothetical protein Clacol_004988 [Clathrus columnatus]